MLNFGDNIRLYFEVVDLGYDGCIVPRKTFLFSLMQLFLKSLNWYHLQKCRYDKMFHIPSGSTVELKK